MATWRDRGALMRTVADSLGSWARVAVILPLVLLETIIDAAPVFGAELMMLVRRCKWILQEKARLLWRRQAGH
jgi:hypothetical protein